MTPRLRRLVAFPLFALAGCAGVGVDADVATAPPKEPPWAMEGRSPPRASRTQTPAPRDWITDFVTRLVESGAYSPEEWASPIVVGPVVYAAHSGKAVAAIRWVDGSVLWTVPARGRVFGTPAYADGILFVGDDEGYLTALRQDGREAWRFRAPYPIVSSPVAAAGKVYVGISDQNVYCLEAATGRPMWQYGRKFPRRNSQWRTPSIAWDEGRVYAGFADGSVVALDGEIGRVLWKAETNREGLFGDILAGPASASGRIYAGSLRGPVVCLDAATGKELWRQDVEVAAGFAVGDEVLYAGTAAGKLLALTLSDGRTLWEAPLDGGVPTAPVLAGDSVVVAASQGSVFSFDAKTGAQRERFAPGSGVRCQPAVFDGGILLVTNAGSLYRIWGRR